MMRPLLQATAFLTLGAAAIPVVAGPPEDAAGQVAAKRDEYAALADEIWSFAEPAMHEFRSARRLAARLQEQGFQVEMGVAGMPTAFVATAGSGRPRIGFLAEYDALPGLAQAAAPERQPLPADAGHGCGHNLLGVGEIAAAEAVAAVLREQGLPGTVVVYGTPAEETGIGKVFLARDGFFDGLDASLVWHPANETVATFGTTLALNSARFRFHGVSSHAAASPEEGRSALDAVEIMDVAVNFLREHVADDVRIHYAITRGGDVPNVVPADAEVWYFVRAPRRSQVEEVFARVVHCAEAGALAAGVDLSMQLESAMWEINPNETLARLMDRYLRAYQPPALSAEGEEFGTALRATLDLEGGPVRGAPGEPAGGWVWRASTDVGDVSWIAPTTMLKVATWPAGCPMHSWQAVASGRSEIGYSGMIWAAQTMAATAVELLTDPVALESVQEEFRRRTGGKPFQSGMPADVPPPAVAPPEGYPSGVLER